MRSLTFTVELEGGQGSVDAHGDRPVFEQRVGQQLLVTLRNLLVPAALGRFARLPVLAGLLLNATRTAKRQLKQLVSIAAKASRFPHSSVQEAQERADIYRLLMSDLKPLTKLKTASMVSIVLWFHCHVTYLIIFRKYFLLMKKGETSCEFPAQHFCLITSGLYFLV